MGVIQMQAMDFYHQIPNPLDNDDIFMSIIDAYCSDKSFYNAITRTITKKTPNKITGRYTRADADSFYTLLFDCWKKNIIDSYQKNLVTPENRSDCYRTIQVLKNFNPTTRGEVENFFLGRTIKDLKVKDFVERTRWNRCGEFSGWDHIDSSYIFLGRQKRYPIEHRLYINCDSTSLYRLMTKFVQKCLTKKLRFYFKFDECSGRDDAMVIYCDIKHLPHFINILREIKQEDETLQKTTYAPTILSGNIDGWIGYGSEPDRLPNGELTSFNEKRKNHLQSTMDKYLFDYILKNNNRTVQLIDGRKLPFKDYFIEWIVADKIERMSSSLKFYKNPKQSIGYDEEDIHTTSFYQRLKATVSNNYYTILNSLRTRQSYSLPVSLNNTKIDLRKSDVEKTLRKQLQYFLKKTEFKKGLKEAIKESCREEGIDPNNYAFDLKALEQLKALDKHLAASAAKKAQASKAAEKQSGRSKRSQYRPMTDEEILASRKKINSTSVVQKSKIKAMHMNSEYPYDNPHHLRRNNTQNCMFDYNLADDEEKKYKK